jgi:hypothetical protein
MPLVKDEDFGTNADASKNEEYCHYCYQNGEFTNPNMTKEEMTELLVGMSDKMGMTPDAAREMATTVLPTLKRWQ